MTVLVEDLPVLETVVKLPEQFVEQVPCRCGVSVAVVSAFAVILPRWRAVGSGGECPDPPGGLEPVILVAAEGQSVDDRGAQSPQRTRPASGSPALSGGVDGCGPL
jgi:hypothetical protein